MSYPAGCRYNKGKPKQQPAARAERIDRMARITDRNAKLLTALTALASTRGFAATDQTAVDEFGDFTILNITFRAADGRMVAVTARLGARNAVSNLRVLASIGRNGEGRAVLETLPVELMTTLTDTLLSALSLAE